MRVYKIENYQKEKTVYKPESVYDCLVENFGIDEDDASEAFEWCEESYDGDVYKGDGFTVKIEEE